MIEQTIRVTLNGEQRTVAAGLPVLGLLEQLSIDPRLIALALNGDVIPRDKYSDTRLQEDDRVEVVRMVGGG